MFNNISEICFRLFWELKGKEHLLNQDSNETSICLKTGMLRESKILSLILKRNRCLSIIE